MNGWNPGSDEYRFRPNDDGTLDISDPSMTLYTLFLGAAPLPAPYPDPGFDPTADDPFTCGF